MVLHHPQLEPFQLIFLLLLAAAAAVNTILAQVLVAVALVVIEHQLELQAAVALPNLF